MLDVSVKLSLFFFFCEHSQGTPSDSKNAKKKNNKKTNKNKSSVSRANKKKPGMPNVANDLSQKLYATMEKHKEVPHVSSCIVSSLLWLCISVTGTRT